MPAAIGYLDSTLSASTECFYAQCDNPKDIAYAIRALYSKEKAKIMCTVCIYATGMFFNIDLHKDFQGRVYFKRSFFNEYDVREDGVEYEFRISLTDLLHAIGSLKGNPSFSLAYNREESYFKVQLRDGFVDNKIYLSTYEAGGVLDFTFENPIAKFLVETKTIQFAFQEVEPSLVQAVKFTFSENEFIMSTSSETLTTVSVFPRGSSEVLGLSTNEEGYSQQYKSQYIKRLRYAVTKSDKLAIRINDEGACSFQFSLKVAPQNTFVEFFALPMNEERLLI